MVKKHLGVKASWCENFLVQKPVGAKTSSVEKLVGEKWGRKAAKTKERRKQNAGVEPGVEGECVGEVGQGGAIFNARSRRFLFSFYSFPDFIAYFFFF